MGDVPIGRREAGGRSPGGGRSVTQREVMRAVAMMIEKKVHPKDPQGSLLQESQGSLARTPNSEPTPAVSLV